MKNMMIQRTENMIGNAFIRVCMFNIVKVDKSLAVFLASSMFMLGCGQKGALYLPKENTAQYHVSGLQAKKQSYKKETNIQKPQGAEQSEQSSE